MNQNQEEEEIQEEEIQEEEIQEEAQSGFDCIMTSDEPVVCLNSYGRTYPNNPLVFSVLPALAFFNGFSMIVAMQIFETAFGNQRWAAWLLGWSVSWVLTWSLAKASGYVDSLNAMEKIVDEDFQERFASNIPFFKIETALIISASSFVNIFIPNVHIIFLIIGITILWMILVPEKARQSVERMSLFFINKKYASQEKVDTIRSSIEDLKQSAGVNFMNLNKEKISFLKLKTGLWILNILMFIVGLFVAVWALDFAGFDVS
jgi:hypothetical protein